MFSCDHELRCDIFGLMNEGSVTLDCKMKNLQVATR